MKKKFVSVIMVLCLMASLGLEGCSSSGEEKEAEQTFDNAYDLMESINTGELNVIDDKYRNYYEIFPYTFCDSDNDGIGDLKGITSKLDYIQDMGINAIWLTPVCQSTTYHKYDVVDYYSIDEQFGDMDDFEELIDEADDRDIDVITDLVLNHTSSQHEWFLAAANYLREVETAGTEPNEADCKYYGYYNFCVGPASGYSKVPGTENYYYECRFWSGMPDLNLDNQDVRDEIEDIVDFWIDEGVAGFRLDATTSYYTGSNDKNIEFLTWLNDVVKDKDPDAYVVGECWEPNATYTSYYASGIDSFFSFDFADSKGTIAKTLSGSAASGYGRLVETVEEEIKAENPDGIVAAFSGNHDMGRTAGYFAGDDSEAQTKMAQALAMMEGGNYFLYYGDEIGMKGNGDDENKRAPMQWSVNPDAEGMCDGVTTKEIEMKYGSVEDQQNDGDSIYSYVCEGLKLRNTYPEIARGTTTMVEELSTESVVVLEKDYEGSQILIVMNTTAEPVDVDLSTIELNGKTAGDVEVAGTLLTGLDKVTVDGTNVTMPAYSVELFK